MARYIDAVICADIISEKKNISLDDLVDVFAEVPTADVVEIETLRSWLYSIAINNVECDIQMTLSEACKDIISRLDGLRNFAKERENK